MRSKYSYRGARRDRWRVEGGKFPWPNQNTIYKGLPPPRPNKRDRSKKREYVIIDFCSRYGLWMAQVNHKVSLPPQAKSSRGWASKVRAKPLENYLDENKLHAARLRHKWYKKLTDEQRERLRNQDALLRTAV